MPLRSSRIGPALSALAALTCAGGAAAHSLGGEDGAGPTPPMKAYLEEVRALGRDLPNGVGVRGVLDQFKLWPVNAAPVVCFNNGDQALRRLFVETSQRWLAGTSLRFDFGSAPGYRNCAGAAKADIRVSFNPADGHWSYVGTDSLSFKTTTLNIGYSQVPDSDVHRARLEEVVLHEVGHAIGFEHEHQSPESKCEDEFDWPKVYTYAKTRWGWVKNGEVDKEAVDFNMRVLTSTERLRMTPYDRLSIMHYYFEPALFKRGRASPCFVGHNRVLSETDKRMAREAYPASLAMQDDHLQKRADIAAAALAPMGLSVPQLSRVGRALGQVLAAVPRKIVLDFDLDRASGNRAATRGPGDFKPCEGQPAQAGDGQATVACEVAANASAILVGVAPK